MECRSRSLHLQWSLSLQIITVECRSRSLQWSLLQQIITVGSVTADHYNGVSQQIITVESVAADHYSGVCRSRSLQWSLLQQIITMESVAADHYSGVRHSRSLQYSGVCRSRLLVLLLETSCTAQNLEPERWKENAESKLWSLRKKCQDQNSAAMPLHLARLRLRLGANQLHLQQPWQGLPSQESLLSV